jgi:glycosyltransferase involved in cell wall biosynthesis
MPQRADTRVKGRMKQYTASEERPLVSIIIPARDEEKNLTALLASLGGLEFPHKQLEIIVVDHESSDDTRGVALSAGARVLIKQGGTIASVRNFGASVASGQILAFVDADCTVAKDWLSKALSHFADPQVGAVGSYHLVPLEPPTWVRKVLQKQIEARSKLAEAKWLPSGNMLIRRDVFWECNGFDESLTTCEDVDLSFRVAQRHRLIPDISVRCWHHGEPTTLWEVFRKELWRGHDNFLGALRHGLRFAEIPSLFLPLYFVVALTLFLASPLIAAVMGWGVLWSIVWTGMLFISPVLLLAVFMSARSGALGYAPHFALFYVVYFLARGFAPLYEWRNC